MINTDVDFNQKRDFSDIINVTFSFIKQEFKELFSTIAIYTFIPLLGVAIISVFYTSDTWGTYIQGIVSRSPAVEAPNLTYLLLLIVLSIVGNIMVMGITFEYVNLYNIKRKGNFTRADVANAFAKDFLKILGYNLVIFIVIFFAFLFFIIPGIYLSVPLAFVTLVLIAEKTGFSKSWSRCFEFIRDNWWITFALILITYIIIGIMSLVFSIPMSIYGGIQGYTAASMGEFDMNFGILTIFSIISTLGSAWLYVIMYIMLGAQYYSLNSNKSKASSILDRINEIEDRPVEDSF